MVDLTTFKKNQTRVVVHADAKSACKRNRYKNLGIKNVTYIKLDHNIFKIGKKNILNKKYAR